MVEVPPYNRLEIDLTALRDNFRQLVALVGPLVKVMAVVKADAYGHGLLEAAGCLARAGAAIFGVTDVTEGQRLREGGITGEVVVLLGGRTGSVAELLRNDLTPVVYDREYLRELAGAAAAAGRQAPVHLKVDTGMGRLGILPGEVPEYLEFIGSFPSLRLAGILSHFPMADGEDLRPTAAQNQSFGEIVAQLGVGGEGVVVHIANSAALLREPPSRHAMVRPGITLYGCYPGGDPGLRERLRVQPVMSFKSRILQVKEVAAGSGVSYGHLFRAERATRLAVLPVGYADGYLRRLTGRAQVLIGGRRVPVVGRICMNLCMADITGLDGIGPGDEVVLLGRQGTEEITADELAGWQETISYEVLCLFGASNQRVYLPERGV
ncbi:MAG TPA: alanine racemase [Desulfurivibrionaceae bacterium]|nr:alanine racemase [Desulfurivibrionaceae bacterium]